MPDTSISKCSDCEGAITVGHVVTVRVNGGPSVTYHDTCLAWAMYNNQQDEFEAVGFDPSKVVGSMQWRRRKMWGDSKPTLIRRIKSWMKIR